MKIRWFYRLFKVLRFLTWIAGEMGKKQNPINWKRIFRFLSLSFLGLVIFGVTWVVAYTKGSQLEEGARYNCAVVFGAAVWRDDQPSHALYDRVATAANLYKQGMVPCVIVSGGSSKFGSHETTVMKNLAQQLGVRSRDIRTDFYGINTLATIINLPKEPGFVMVSNDFHLGRIILMARLNGFKDLAAFPAIYHEGRYHKNLNYFGREVAGVLLYGTSVWE